jgi:hypothetical protein
MKKLYKLMFVAVILCFSQIPFFPDQNNEEYNEFPQNSSNSNSSLIWKSKQGIVGNGPTIEPEIINYSSSLETLFICTDEGYNIIDFNGTVITSFSFSNPVIDFDVSFDVTGDEVFDIFAITYQNNDANIHAIDSEEEEIIWEFAPTVTGFNPDTMQSQDFIIYSWCIETVSDINEDGYNDLIISSWFHLYALSGIDGSIIWSDQNLFSNDVWRIVKIQDVNQNGYSEILAGSESGELILIDSKTGNQIWKFTIQPLSIQMDYGSYIENISIPMSVDDIIVLDDIDSDSISDILISSDDGYIRTISGLDGNLISKISVYNFDRPDTISPYDWENQLYSTEKRIFGKSGVKIFPTFDLTGDGQVEFISYATDLSLTDVGANRIYCNVIDVFAEDLTKISSFDYSSEKMSYPSFCNISGDVRAYYSKPLADDSIYPNEYNPEFFYLTVSLPAFTFSGPTYVIPPFYYGIVPNSKLNSFIVWIPDQTGDFVNELFICDEIGHFKLFDPINSVFLWEQNMRTGSSEIKEIRDISGDGIDDFMQLIKGNTFVEWINPNYDQYIEEIIQVNIISGVDGSVLWTLTNTYTDYDGFRDFIPIGDFTGDSIMDFASWIIPNSLPQQVSSQMKSISNYDDLSTVDDDVKKAFLINYTRILGIDGASGRILRNEQIITNPYRFARYSTHDGTYLTPTNQWVDAHGRIFNTNHDNRSKWWSTIWDNLWNVSSLYHATSFETTSNFQGIIENLENDDDHLEFESMLSHGLNEVSVNFSIPIPFSKNKSLGISEYPLSELERISSIRFQSMVNITNYLTSSYEYTYSIFNYSSNEWVSCNWDKDGINGYWDTDHPNLFGNWAGYRNSYSDFKFQSFNAFDVGYLQTRGTDLKDAAVFLNLSRPTKLFDFIDPDSSSLKIKFNITSSDASFNFTIQSFGIGAFSWGLANNWYDSTYMWYDHPVFDPIFSSSQLSELDIVHFDYINGLGGSCGEVLVILGRDPNFQVFSKNIPNTFRLFDFVNNQSYTKWSLNNSYYPTLYTKIVTRYQNDSNFVLIGKMQTNLTSNTVHIVQIENMHWDSQLSRFDNYSDIETLYNSEWNVDTYSLKNLINPIIRSISDTEWSIFYPIMLGEKVWNIKSYNFNDGMLQSNIPTSELLLSGFEEHTSIEDFYKLLLAVYDFDNDNVKDHIGMFKDSDVPEIRVYSGASTDELYSYRLTEVGTIYPEHYLEMPFCLANISNNIRVVVGLQGYVDQNGDIGQVGSELKIINIQEGSYDRLIIDQFQDPGEDKSLYSFMQNVDGRDNYQGNTLIFQRYVYSSLGYSEVTQVIDINLQKIVGQFLLLPNDLYQFTDINGDHISEKILTIRDTIFCLSSSFKVSFTNPYNAQTMKKGRFQVTWNTSSTYSNFEFLVDGYQHAFLKETAIDVSLGFGPHELNVLMFDNENLFVSIDSVRIFVPRDHRMWLISGAIVVAIPSFLLLRKNKDKIKNILRRKNR